MTIANLALLPDWNSLDSVRRAHSDLELAAIVFFALLVLMEALAHNSTDEKRKHVFDAIGIWLFAIAVICELFAYRYGQRNDFLSASVISSLDTKAGDALTKASQAHDLAQGASGIASEVEGRADVLNKHIDADSVKLSTLETRLAWRRISPKQFISFKKNLSPFAGSSVFVVLSGTGSDTETESFAGDIARLFHDSGWQMRGTRVGVMMPAPVGLTCHIADPSHGAGRALARICKELPSGSVSTTASPVPFSNAIPAGAAGLLILGPKATP